MNEDISRIKVAVVEINKRILQEQHSGNEGDMFIYRNIE